MKNSLISWTHNTQNFWVGCDKVAPECAKCYIGREVRKQADWEGDGSLRQPWGEVYLTKTWADPYKWQAELTGTNKAKRIFTCSLSDFFHAKIDKRKFRQPKTLSEKCHIVLDAHGSPIQSVRDAAWQVIKDTPNLVYLILTKRPELIMSRLPKDWGIGYPNVWIGTSVGCNQSLSKIDSLRKVPVHPSCVRFISAEPLLEDISEKLDLTGIGWVIVGGESGSNPEYLWDASADWRAEMNSGEDGRRIMMLDWAMKIRDMSVAAGIPFYFKQVSSGRQHIGMRALGRYWREYPAPPEGMQWVPDDVVFDILD